MPELRECGASSRYRENDSAAEIRNIPRTEEKLRHLLHLGSIESNSLARIYDETSSFIAEISVIS